ncbi:uncharacterized protein [Prorops nasuta]|uniref:uncharacterized protein isoform X2 n=1 Tax=Prorops nasuta TaxID=863751 RepID=UPI0034CF1EA4
MDNSLKYTTFEKLETDMQQSLLKKDETYSCKSLCQGNLNSVSKEKHVFKHWSLILNKEGQLFITGEIGCGKIGRSEPIVRRISAFTVESNNKQTYHLEGNIEDKRKELLDYARRNFFDGFPKDWEYVCKVWRYYVYGGCKPTFRWPVIPSTDTDNDIRNCGTDPVLTYERQKMLNQSTNDNKSTTVIAPLSSEGQEDISSNTREEEQDEDYQKLMNLANESVGLIFQLGKKVMKDLSLKTYRNLESRLFRINKVHRALNEMHCFYSSQLYIQEKKLAQNIHVIGTNDQNQKNNLNLNCNFDNEAVKSSVFSHNEQRNEITKTSILYDFDDSRIYTKRPKTTVKHSIKNTSLERYRNTEIPKRRSVLKPLEIEKQMSKDMCINRSKPRKILHRAKNNLNSSFSLIEDDALEVICDNTDYQLSNITASLNSKSKIDPPSDKAMDKCGTVNKNIRSFESKSITKSIDAENLESVHENQKKAKILTDWLPKVINESGDTSKFSLIFEGKLLNKMGHIIHRKFSTNIVKQRLSSKIFKTVDEEIYELIGSVEDKKDVILKVLLSECKNDCPTKIYQFCKIWTSLEKKGKLVKSDINHDSTIDALCDPVTSGIERDSPHLNDVTEESITLEDDISIYGPVASLEYENKVLLQSPSRKTNDDGTAMNSQSNKKKSPDNLKIPRKSAINAKRKIAECLL